MKGRKYSGGFFSNTTYDFTTSASQAYGSNMKNLSHGRFALYSGEVNADNTINLLDHQLIRDATRTFTDDDNTYDLTGDLLVESADFSIVENNLIRNTLHP